MAASSKATRECTRAPKYSILLSNVLGIQLSPSAVLDLLNDDPTDDDDKNTKPQQSSSGKEIFESFIKENQSTMHTRLNETLSEVRYAGWIQPSTLLLKGPTDELDVLREAWRRRFLRSPWNFIIRDIGNISSVGMELVPQAPFLPLTQALYEAISTLNENELPSTQKDVFQYLAHTYQYVHVPKVHVIHDCLGILIKEKRIYYTGNAYFAYPDMAVKSEETVEDKKQGKDAKDAAGQCSMCDAAKKKEKGEGKSHKRHGSKGRDHEHLCEKHRKGVKRTHSHRKRSSGKESHSLSTSMESGATLKESSNKEDSKGNKKSVNSESSGSQTTVEHSNEKKTKEKPAKGNMFGQIASFIKGRKSSNSGASQESHSEKEKEKEDGKVINKQNNITIVKEEEPLQVVSDQSKDNVTPKASDVSLDVFPKASEPTFTRSRSFVGPNRKRPEFLRSNSFTAPSNKAMASRSLSNTGSDNSPRLRTKSAERPLSVRGSIEYRRPTPKGQEVSPTAQVEQSMNSRYLPISTRDVPRNRNSVCAVGIVRPMHTHAQNLDSEILSRSSSTKENHRYSASSFGTPPSDCKGLGSESRNFSRSSSLRDERSFEYVPIKIAKSPERDFEMGSPLQRLLTKNTGTSVPVSAPGHSARYTSTPLPTGSQYTSSSSSFARSQSQSSSRSNIQHRHSFHGGSSNKRSAWRTPIRSRDDGYDVTTTPDVTSYNELSSRDGSCMSPICYDQSKLMGTSGTCKCNGSTCCRGSLTNSDRSHGYSEKDELSSVNTKSDHIFLDEISSSASSTDFRSVSRLKTIDNDSALSPLMIAEGQVIMDSSLTFIGVI